MDPLTLLLAAGAASALGALALAAAWRWPQAALAAGYPLFLLGTTKYRDRGSAATLSGAIDLQVIFELGMSALLGAMVVAAVLSLRLSIRRPTTMEALLLAYGLVALASTVWSETPTYTLVRAYQVLLVVALTAAAVRALGPRGAMASLTAAIVAYVVVMAAIAAAVPSTRVYDLSGSDRFNWWAAHAITTATFAGGAAMLLVAEAWFVPRERRTRIFGLPLLPFVVPLVVVLLAARSRGPLIAFLAALLVTFFRRYSKPWLASLSLALCAGATLAFAWITAGDAFGAWVRDAVTSDNPAIELVTRGNAIEYLRTMGGRTKLWEVVAELFRARPILGYGYAASREVLYTLVPWAAYAHNALAQTLLDLGVVGAIPIWTAFLLSLFADFLKRSWTGQPEGSVRGPVFASLLFILVLSVVSESFAGPPGFEILLVFTAILAGERARIREPIAVRD